MSKEEDKDIDNLIESLAEQHGPVRRMLHPVLFVSPWLVITFAYFLGVIHFLGVRMDIGQQLHNTSYVFELGLSLMLAVTSAYAAGWLAVPDVRQQKWILAVPLTFFGALMLWICCRIFIEGINLEGFSFHHCFSDALLMGFVPVAVLCVLVRRGATTHPSWMAFMSAMSVGALGWTALRITCPAEHMEHIMLFHFMPYMLLAGLLGVLARRIYKW